MRLYVDLDTLGWFNTGSFRSPVAGFALRRGDLVSFEVQFLSNGAIIDPGTPTLKFDLKEVGKYDSTPVVSVTSWTKTGSGTSAVWTGVIDTTSAAISDLLYVDGNPANDLSSITLMGALRWAYGSVDSETSPLAITVGNNIVRSTSARPIVAASGIPLLLWASASAGTPYTLRADAVTVSSWARASNVLTLNTSAAHGLAVGNAVEVSGEAAINGAYVVASVVDSDTITVVQTGANASAGSSTASTRKLTDTLYGVSTAALAYGTCALVDPGDGTLAHYVLLSGTTATSLPASLRGYDYASSTNERYWARRFASTSVAWSDVTSKPSTFTPSTHASTHGYAGSDPITITTAQVTGLTDSLSGLESNVTALLSGLAATQEDVSAIQAWTAADLPSGILGSTYDQLNALNVRTAGVFVTSNYEIESIGLHIVLATATITDPSPSVVPWYIVLVRTGIATIGSTAYAPGTLVYRVHDGSAWISYPFVNDGTLNTLGNADATLAATDRRVILGATLTAVRTITLPAASAVPAGIPVTVFVPSGTISQSYALLFTRAGSDTINGITTVGLMTDGVFTLVSDGVSKWALGTIPGVSQEVATQEDVTTTTLTDSTALKRYVPPGKYMVRAEFTVWTANTAEGVRGNVAFSGTATTRSARVQMDASSTSATSSMSSRPVNINSTALSGNDPLSYGAFSTGSGWFFREFIMTVTAGGILSVQCAHWSGTSSTCSLGVGGRMQIVPIG